MTCLTACSDPPTGPRDGDGVGDSHYDLYVMNADGTNVRRLTSDPAQENDAAWSPDGTEIVFVRGEDGKLQLFRVSADGGEAVRVSVPARSDFAAEWVRPHQW